MLSGSQALQNINLTLQQLHQQVDQSSRQIQLASESMLDLQQEQAERYRKLAKIRLDNIISGKVVAGLDAADVRVRELLQIRTDALSDLSARLESTRSDQQKLEQRRESQGDHVAAAATALDDQETATREHLQHDQAYISQQQEAQQHIPPILSHVFSTSGLQGFANITTPGPTTPGCWRFRPV